VEGWDQEDCGSRPASENSLCNPISKITTAKWTDCVSQMIEHWHCKCDALSSYPSPTKNKKKQGQKGINGVWTWVQNWVPPVGLKALLIEPLMNRDYLHI
jgi:hypothetical protein